MGAVLSLALYTPAEVARQLGERTAQLRLARNWKRETLAERAGVSVFLIKRFESGGQVSLENLLKLALALDCLDQFEALLQPPPARSLAELDRQTSAPPRRRGTR